jgi:hypothetical protein
MYCPRETNQSRSSGKGEMKMNVYRVTLGSFPESSSDVLLILAENCSQAEKKAVKYEGEDFEASVHVTKVEELTGTFVK